VIYQSTRGQAPELSFEDAVLAGMASDGGLYVPKELPRFSADKIRSFAGMRYEEVAFEVMKPFVAEAISDQELKQLIEESYSEFRHSAVAPMVQLDQNLWVLELFHGPTLAFKDFALQFLGRLLDLILKRRNQKVVIMGATSGDTGSAAIEGCRRCDNVDIFILHPYKRVSDVQRRQMTTVIADNVRNIALEGNFDDCQNMVKASFSDQSFLPEDRQLVAVNSINWARIMAQIVYYFYSAVALGAPDRPVSYSVPTGNFGDIFAGYLASKMGLPIDKLIVATNSNDILHRCISDNDYSLHPLVHSLSPSMDIMISSNFERMLFDLYEGDASAIAELMDDLKNTGSLKLGSMALNRARTLFGSYRLDDDEMIDVIRDEFTKNGYLLDPHTAIGVAAGRKHQAGAIPMVCLATAHPAKFPEAVKKSGYPEDPALPHHMEDLFDREEAYEVISKDQAEVQKYIVANIRK
jgi:threonine synthase